MGVATISQRKVVFGIRPSLFSGPQIIRFAKDIDRGPTCHFSLPEGLKGGQDSHRART
jgi:hypothetical protein